MIASQVTFEQMKRYAANNPDLGEATSFLQVEYGISELHACWDGFVHTSDAFNQEFKSRKQVCAEFTYALTEYIDYLGESSYLQHTR
jgi:hypothetical protein